MSSNESKKKSPVPYIIAGVVVALVAVAVVMMFRVKLLNTQLELGAGFLNDKKFDEAEEAYNQALKIYPSSADAYLGLAEASIGKGDLTQAISILDKGIQKTKSSNLEQSKTVIMDQVYATYVMNEYLINILPDDTFQMTITNRSEDMGFDATWSIEDGSIASIDETGLIKASQNGTTQIIAHLGNDVWGYRDVTATLIVGRMTTYLEDKGCEYVSNAKNLTAPAFTYQEDNDGLRIYDGTLEIEQQDAIYDLISVSASDPNADGNIVYEAKYTITVPMKFGILADSKEAKKEWYYNWAVKPLFLVDDYTGQIFSEQDFFGEEGVSYDSEVNWNNLNFHITGSMSNEWKDDAEWETSYSPLTEITWAETPAIGTYTLSVTVPKEYQGLVLVLDKAGVTDYTDPETEEDYDPNAAYTDTFFFDQLEDGSVRKPEDFEFIRLADFVN